VQSDGILIGIPPIPRRILLSTLTGRLRSYRLPRIDVEPKDEAESARPVVKPPRAAVQLVAAAALFGGLLGLMTVVGVVVALALFR
jgi:hypothetical protein